MTANPAAEAPALEDVARALGFLTAVLRESATAANRGDAVELAGLEAECESVLAGVLARPAEQARALLPRVLELKSALDEVEAALLSARDRLRDADEAERRRRAAAAYRAAPEQGS